MLNHFWIWGILRPGRDLKLLFLFFWWGSTYCLPGEPVSSGFSSAMGGGWWSTRCLGGSFLSSGIHIDTRIQGFLIHFNHMWLLCMYTKRYKALMLIILTLLVCKSPFSINHWQESLFRDLWNLALLLSDNLGPSQLVPEDWLLLNQWLQKKLRSKTNTQTQRPLMKDWDWLMLTFQRNSEEKSRINNTVYQCFVWRQHQQVKESSRQGQDRALFMTLRFC